MKVRMKNFILWCMLVLGLANGNQRNKQILLLDGINGRKCPSSHQVFTRTIHSSMACVAICLSTTTCRSVFYGQTTGKCYGCDRVYETDFGLETETDTLYYMDTDEGVVFAPGLPNQGLVKVWYNGKWGTICDDWWYSYEQGNGVFNVIVICRMFGYNSGGEVLAKGSYSLVDSTNVPIWMDDVFCSGTETTVLKCAFLGFGNHNCNHEEDVSVNCYT